MHEGKRLLGLVCLALLAAAGSVRGDTGEVTHTEDVIYGRKYGMALTLDVFAPRNNRNGKAVIQIISGGWFSGHGRISTHAFREYLRHGYTVFAGVHSSQPKFTIPEIVEDMHRGVRFIRYHARDYHIDPDQIGVTGASAGAHLALILATSGKEGNPRAQDPVDRVSSRVRAVACFFPPTDFLNWGSEGTELTVATMPAPFTAAIDFHEYNRKKALYEPIKDEKKVRKILEQISPITHVSRGDPPTLIFHGEKDRLVPLQQSERFVARLKEVDVPARLIVKQDAGHGWVTITDDFKVCADWFDRYLQGKADKEKAAAERNGAEREKAGAGRSR